MAMLDRIIAVNLSDGSTIGPPPAADRRLPRVPASTLLGWPEPISELRPVLAPRPGTRSGVWSYVKITAY